MVEHDAAGLVLADDVELLLGAAEVAAAIGECPGAEGDALAVGRELEGVDVDRRNRVTCFGVPPAVGIAYSCELPDLALRKYTVACRRPRTPAN